MFLAFKDIVGTLLALASTWIGIVIAVRAMALAGEGFNIALGRMPVTNRQ